MHQISIFSWFGFSIPMVERFKLIKEAGFDGVLLWWSDEYAEVDGDKSLHPELARRNGLLIENMHTPIFRNNCIWEDSIDGDALEKALYEHDKTAIIYQVHSPEHTGCRLYVPVKRK